MTGHRFAYGSLRHGRVVHSDAFVGSARYQWYRWVDMTPWNRRCGGWLRIPEGPSEWMREHG